MLGSYAQNQVVHTVASVFAVLWDQAHRLDPQRAGTAGWICHLARRESLACLRAGLPSGSVQFPDEPRFRILTLELSGLPTGSSAELNGILRQLPDAPPPAGAVGCDEDSMDGLADVWIAAYGIQTGGRRTRLTAIGSFLSPPGDGALRLGHAGPRCCRRGADTRCGRPVTSLRQRSTFSRNDSSHVQDGMRAGLFVAGLWRLCHACGKQPPTAPIVPTGLQTVPRHIACGCNLFPLIPLDFDGKTVAIGGTNGCEGWIIRVGRKKK
jgi:hypothetical protein